MQFHEVAEKFTNRLEQKRMSARTITLYGWAIKQLNKHFYAYEMDEIGPEDIDYLKGLASTKAASTVNTILTVLHAIMIYAAEIGQLAEGKIPKMHFLKPNMNEHTLSDEEQDRLLLHCHGELKLMVYLALTLGLRRSSIFTLKWSEIQGGILRKKTKRGKIVELPIAPRVWLMLEHHREKLRSKNRLGEYVFPSPRSMNNESRTQSADAGLNTVFKKAGLPYTGWHILRHTFATNFLNQTNNVILLKEILGHSNVNQTSRYCHPNLKAKQAALDEFAKTALKGENEDDLILQRIEKYPATISPPASTSSDFPH